MTAACSINAIGLAVLTLLAASCSATSDLVILNGNEDGITDLTISDGRSTWKLGDVRAAQSVSFDGGLSGEGGPTISWTWRGKRYSGEGCYYSAPHFSSEGKLVINQEKLVVEICR